MNAELLLMFVLECDRAYLYGHPERVLTAQEQTRYEETLAQRSAGVPAQYITGHQEFWGMDLIVSPRVLIPRPETEHVIETVMNRMGSTSGDTGGTFLSELRAGESTVPKLRIVDVGTGSGCIALALAKEFPRAEIHATEISAAALEMARANAARHQSKRIHFHETDLLDGIQRKVFDFVVSNPPYVGASEEEQVQLEVRKFEPRTAVFAGSTGMEVIDRLIPQAHEVLRPGGWLVMEISGTIAGRVQESLAMWHNLEITHDLAGIPRVVSAQTVP
jgi:release factor glutamine methyltransferase